MFDFTTLFDDGSDDKPVSKVTERMIEREDPDDPMTEDDWRDLRDNDEIPSPL